MLISLCKHPLDPDLYVFVGGSSLKNKSGLEILQEIKKYSIIKPSKIIKAKDAAGFCHIKFLTKEDAALFYDFYKDHDVPLCPSLSPSTYNQRGLERDLLPLIKIIFFCKNIYSAYNIL